MSFFIILRNSIFSPIPTHAFCPLHFFYSCFADTIRSNVDTDIIFEILVVTNADADADSDVDTNTNTSKIANILIYIFTFSLPQSA